MDAQRRIGILCKLERPVFVEVADRLRKQGSGVQFFEPQSSLATAGIDELSLIVNKQVFPHNLTAEGRSMSGSALVEQSDCDDSLLLTAEQPCSARSTG